MALTHFVSADVPLRIYTQLTNSHRCIAYNRLTPGILDFWLSFGCYEIITRYIPTARVQNT